MSQIVWKFCMPLGGFSSIYTRHADPFQLFVSNTYNVQIMTGIHGIIYTFTGMSFNDAIFFKVYALIKVS